MSDELAEQVEWVRTQVLLRGGNISGMDKGVLLHCYDMIIMVLVSFSQTLLHLD